MRRRRRTGTAQRGGFTLMEVLLVMAILVILGSLVVINFTNIMGGAKVKKAKVELALIKTQLGTYFMDVGNYPAQQEGLAALESQPPSLANTNKWNGPYPDGGVLPKDPWNQSYEYGLEVGQNGISQRVTIFSKGPDMQPNTPDDIKVVFGG